MSIMSYLRTIRALLWKDILLEWRSKEISIPVFVFSVLVIMVFNFVFDTASISLVLLAPGILWISIIFGGVIGFNRSLSAEKETGGIHGLMMSPVERDVIFFGKMLSTLVFLLVVEVLIFVVFSVLFNFSLFTPLFILLAVLATLGMSLVGTLFSAIAVTTRSREVMLPILFLPVVLPLIIATVEATGTLMVEGVTKDLFHWVSLLVIFDSVFLVICPVAFTFIIED